MRRGSAVIVASLKLHLLGEFRVETGTGEDIAITSKKSQALLAYLALATEQKQNRDKLAFLLWSDRPDERARHSLRQCVLTLRKTLGDETEELLVAESEWLSMGAGAVEVDALTFERLVGEDAREALEQALGVYVGELLEGLNIRSEEFEAWLSAERPRFRALAVNALTGLAELRAAAGDLDAAVEAAQRLLAEDSAHEPAHRLLIRIYAGSGRRSIALRQYQICAKALREQLNAEPELETVQLYDEVRTQARDSWEEDAPAEVSAPASEAQPPGVAPAAKPGGGAPTQEPPIVAASAETPPGAPLAKQPDAPDSLQTAANRPVQELLTLTRTAMTALPGVRAALRPRLGSAIGGALCSLAVMAGAGWYLFGDAIKDRTLPVVIEEINRARPGKMAFPLPEKPSIAVLPFENMSHQSAREDLIDGITEGITNALSIMSDMFVIARSSVLRYKDEPFDPQKMAEELGVRYLLMGSVQESGNRVRISAQLVDAINGYQLWASRYDREPKEVFLLQDEITQEIVTALQVEITGRAELRHGTDNLEAWMLAGNGLKHLRRLTQQDNLKARDLYNRAARLDPDYAGAWDGLAWTHFLDARFGWTRSPESSLMRAAELAKKALALDPTRPRTYAILGNLSLMSGDHEIGIELLEKAVALKPNGADVVALLGLGLTYTGEYERSIALMNQAMRLSPYYPSWYRWSLGRAHRLAGQHVEALAWLEANPRGGRQSLIQRAELVATYSEMRLMSKAQAEAVAILKDYPGFSALMWTRWPPYKDPTVTEREVRALTRAGLPS